MVFSGDFFQIPPVNAAPVYLGLDHASDRTSSSLDTIGSNIWHSITNVIILKQSMRHNADPEFSACLKGLQRGICVPCDVTLLNTRVMKPEIYNDLKACIGA